jgi:hypothetical protein
MKLRNRLGPLSLLLAVWCCLSASALFAQSDTTLGSAGELYRVRTGAFKDLFPGQTPPHGLDPVSIALALDVQHPGAAVQRFLVPTTDNSDVELLPSLLYEDSSNTVYLIWETRINNIHPVLMLAGFNNGGFSDPIELTGDSFAEKTHPQIALTHDQYVAAGPGGAPVTRSRKVLHILWAQDDGSGVNTFYSPVIFDGGAYIGWNPVFRINDLDTGAPGTLAYPLSSKLLHSPRLESGSDGRTVNIGFVSSVTQKLMTVELDALPAALSQLADNARAQIIEIGVKLSLPSRQVIADRARTTILTQGADSFRPEVLTAIADNVYTSILTSNAQQNLQNIADMARAQIIEIGGQFSGRGLRSFGDNAAAKIAEVREQPPGESGAPSPIPSQLLQMRLTSSRPAPNVADGAGTGETRIFVSETGERVITSWLDAAGSQLFYRVSDDGTWSDPRVLKLSSSLSLTDAYSVLDQRARSH